MDSVPNKADFRDTLAQHILDELGNGLGIVHQQQVGGERVLHMLRRCVYKEDRQSQVTEHPCIVVVEDLHTHDAAGSLSIKGRRQTEAVNLLRGQPMQGHGVAHLRQLTLKFIQHGGGEVRTTQKSPGK